MEAVWWWERIQPKRFLSDALGTDRLDWEPLLDKQLRSGHHAPWANGHSSASSIRIAFCARRPVFVEVVLLNQ